MDDARTEASSRLFTSNCDDGLRGPAMNITNIEGAFGTGAITGELARKCQKVANRAVWYARDNRDAVLVYRRPDEQFLNYVGELYGHEVTVLAPWAVTDEPLDLMEDILRDPILVDQLHRGVSKYGWTVSPFIRSPKSIELARHLETELEEGACTEHRKSGFTELLNDKAAFAQTCRAVGIRTPETMFVQGWEELLRVTKQQQQAWGGVMARQARAAGGLGNLEISADHDVETRFNEVIKQPGWKTNLIVLTPLMDLHGSPSSLAHIDRSGQVKLITHTAQLVQNAGYVGCLIPPEDLDPQIVDEMRAGMSRYASTVAAQGGRGYVNIDWLHGRDGQIYGCESNYRATAAVHPWIMRRRLCNERRRIAHSYDALHVASNLKFSTVHHRLTAEGLAFNHADAKGVVVSIPPAGGNMGYVIFGENAHETGEMAARVHALFEDHGH